MLLIIKLLKNNQLVVPLVSEVVSPVGVSVLDKPAD